MEKIRICVSCGKQRIDMKRGAKCAHCRYIVDTKRPKRNEAALEAVKKHQMKLRLEINAYKTDSSCVDCGLYWPSYVMQFDHIGDDKLFTIGSAYTSVSRQRLWAEIAKCELVCANCHAVRTHRRLHGL